MLRLLSASRTSFCNASSPDASSADLYTHSIPGVRRRDMVCACVVRAHALCTGRARASRVCVCCAFWCMGPVWCVYVRQAFVARPLGVMCGSGGSSGLTSPVPQPFAFP